MRNLPLVFFAGGAAVLLLFDIRPWQWVVSCALSALFSGLIREILA